MTERGQVSIPAELRREMHLEPGQTLIWQRVSATECRVIIPPKTKIKPDPIAALGFAQRHGLKTPHKTTAEFMRELREGEDE